MVPEVSSTKSPLLGWRLHIGHHAAENTGTLSFSPPLKGSISTLGEGSLKDLKLLPTHPTDPSALQMGVSERSGPWSPLPGQEHWLSNFAWGNQRTWKETWEYLAWGRTNIKHHRTPRTLNIFGSAYGAICLRTLLKAI